MAQLQVSDTRYFERAKDIMQEVGVAMLTNQDSKGHLLSRPMETQRVERDRVLFLAPRDSALVTELQERPHINLAYQSRDQRTFISVSGQAHIRQEEKATQNFMNENQKHPWKSLKNYNPEDLKLVEVDLESLQIWGD